MGRGGKRKGIEGKNLRVRVRTKGVETKRFCLLESICCSNSEDLGERRREGEKERGREGRRGKENIVRNPPDSCEVGFIEIRLQINLYVNCVCCEEMRGVIIEIKTKIMVLNMTFFFVWNDVVVIIIIMTILPKETLRGRL